MSYMRDIGVKKLPTFIHSENVESSNLAHVNYFPAGRLMQITFKNGAVYLYVNVPKKTYDALMAADSKGKYFNAHIKSAFKYRKLRAPRAGKATHLHR